MCLLSVQKKKWEEMVVGEKQFAHSRSKKRFSFSPTDHEKTFSPKNTIGCYSFETKSFSQAHHIIW